MTKLLLTGFTPFDGRDINSSWVAAKSYAKAEHLEIPVVWGEPMGYLEKVVMEIQPHTIISMGEGREGWFDIETRAMNQRKHRIDNLKQYPKSDIIDGGSPVQFASINYQMLHQTMFEEDIPIRISQDAGQFLCEETLYCLETLKQIHACLETVMFVHLPPYGTHLTYRGAEREVNEALLTDFVQRLIKNVQALSDQDFEQSKAPAA